MSISIRTFLNDHGTIVIAFIGVCVLVGLGKIDSKVLDLVIMAMVGRLTAPATPGGSNATSDK